MTEEENQKKFDTGLAIQEMTETKGWKILHNWIEKELEIERNENEEFDLKGKGVPEIAAEYLDHRGNINVYKKVLNMVKTAVEEKEEAAEAMRKE